MDEITFLLKHARHHYDDVICSQWYSLPNGLFLRLFSRVYDARHYVDHFAAVLRAGEKLDGHKIHSPRGVLVDSQALWTAQEGRKTFSFQKDKRQ